MLPIALDTHSTAYHAGEVTGLVIVIVLAGYVIHRALTRGFGRQRASVAAPAHSESSFSGLVVGSAGVSPPPRVQVAHTATREGPEAKDLAIAAVAVVLAGAYIVSGISHGLLDSGKPSPWSTSEGANVRAGFIAGCGKGDPSRERTCECVFAKLSSTPPYDTPAGFEQLGATLAAVERTRDVSALPPALLSGIRSCSTS